MSGPRQTWSLIGAGRWRRPLNTRVIRLSPQPDDGPRIPMSPSSPQEAVILIPLVVALLTTLISIGIHAVAIGAIIWVVHREYKSRRAGAGFWVDAAIVAWITVL